MPIDAFTVSIIDSDTEALVTISGSLDVATIQQLTSLIDPLVTRGAGDVVIDLSAVVFADSTAVHLFTRISLELLADGRRLIMANPSPPVRRVLSLTDTLVWFSPRE